MVCEACGRNEAWSLSYEEGTGWRLCCGCTSGSEQYYIEFSVLPGQDWLGHLRHKRWFSESDFLQALGRMNAQ